MLSSPGFHRKMWCVVPALLVSLILAGCQDLGSDSPITDVQAPESATADSDYYLQQAQHSANHSKAGWQLLAIRALINEGKYAEARQQIQQLPSKLDSAQQQERQLLEAHLRIETSDSDSAWQILDDLDPSSLSKEQQQRYHELRIVLSRDKDTLALIRAYIAQEPLLTGDAHQRNIDITWQILLQLTPEQMNQMVINANEYTLQGWLSLQRIYQTSYQEPEKLRTGIEEWQQRYPRHPAITGLPSDLKGQGVEAGYGGNIALFLPLSGQAKVFAQAIRQGFEDAMNGRIATASNSEVQSVSGQEAGNDPGQVSSPAGESGSPSAQPPGHAKVRVYDTSSRPLPQLLEQARQDGATVIVGPLLKNSVESLSQTPPELNVLALNKPEKVTNSPNICYFALSPEDEARDAARHIRQQGKQMPLLLVPRGALGQRVSNAFATEWKRLGGDIALRQEFGSEQELKQGINNGSGIQLTGTPVATVSEQPADVTIGDVTIPAPEMPDQSRNTTGNIDAVYIVATQSELQLIKPMIAMRISSRTNIALYASSRSFQAGAGADYRLEMEGLQFSDIPLLSGSNNVLLEQAARALRNDYSLVRLYAMGVDAWTLANRFDALRQSPDFQINGNTGKLHPDQDCVIERTLTWSQYRSGKVVPVP